jgi:hypothetical protein
MKIYAYASVFICLVFSGFAQGKHYKNQINRTLKEKRVLENQVEIKESKPSNQTPKYQVNRPNIDWIHLTPQPLPINNMEEGQTK